MKNITLDNLFDIIDGGFDFFNIDVCWEIAGTCFKISKEELYNRLHSDDASESAIAKTILNTEAYMFDTQRRRVFIKTPNFFFYDCKVN